MDRKIKEFYSIIARIIKVMHVDTVFEFFIFNFFIFGYFFYARRGAYLMMVNFLKTPDFGGK